VKKLQHELVTETGVQMQYQVDTGTKILCIRLPEGCSRELKEKIKKVSRQSRHVRSESVSLNGTFVKMRLRNSKDETMQHVMCRIASAIDRHKHAVRLPKHMLHHMEPQPYSPPKPKPHRRHPSHSLGTQAA
jgi:hypothetical protein